MKLAFDFRKAAREALAGKWWLALVAGLIASILGGIAKSGPQIKLELGTEAGVNFKFIGRNFALDPALISFIASIAAIVALVALAFGVAYFIIGSFVSVGYAQFNLDLVDGKAELGTLFSYYKNWATAAVSALLRTIYVFLWSLLFIIPGIVASYSYAMTDYILAENPSLTASQAIEKSKAMMSGNKWRLFCLHFSFIGWDILASITFGIGYLWLNPYKHAAVAAFYRDVCAIEGGTSDTEPVEATFEEAHEEDNTNE